MQFRVCFVAIAILTCVVTDALAEDERVQVNTRNFTVIANGGEKRARDIALQFERYRAAIQTGWAWARQQLDRPVVVIAAKDEATMKLLAPQYWEKGNRLQLVSVSATAPDACFIALRSDVREDDNRNNNPRQSSYWAYASLALTSAFDVLFRPGSATGLPPSLATRSCAVTTSISGVL